jgi:hypothetical protein
VHNTLTLYVIDVLVDLVVQVGATIDGVRPSEFDWALCPQLKLECAQSCCTATADSSIAGQFYRGLQVGCFMLQGPAQLKLVKDKGPSFLVTIGDMYLKFEQHAGPESTATLP